MKYGRGYIPDPPGHRTTSFRLHAASRAASTPPSVALSKFSPPIMDQGQQGSCTGHGTACCAVTSFAAAGRPLAFVPSPRGIYCNARAIDRSTPEIPLSDDGAMPNQVMRSLTEWGVRAMKAPTSDGRYSDCEAGNVNAEPTLAELEEEALHPIIGWYRIDSTGAQRIADVRAALAAGYAVGCGAFVDTAFEDWTPGHAPIGKPNENDPNGGGHWFALVGYRTGTHGETIVRCRNSWSEIWGDLGEADLSEAFIQVAWDLYVFVPKEGTPS